MGASQARVIDAEGRYFFRGLTPGRYLVQVAAAGFVPAERQVEVTGADREVRADVALTRGARLEGRVLSAGTRAPIAGARVSVESGMRVDALAPLFDAVSGADGAFTLEGIPAHGVSMNVSAPGHNTRLLSGVQPSAPVLVELTPIEADAGPKTEMVGIGAVLKARGDALVIGEVIPGGGPRLPGSSPATRCSASTAPRSPSWGSPAPSRGSGAPRAPRSCSGCARPGSPPSPTSPFLVRRSASEPTVSR